VGITRARAAGGKTGDSDNMYINMLESLTPGEMVGQFMETAPPRVQAYLCPCVCVRACFCVFVSLCLCACVCASMFVSV